MNNDRDWEKITVWSKWLSTPVVIKVGSRNPQGKISSKHLVRKHFNHFLIVFNINLCFWGSLAPGIFTWGTGKGFSLTPAAFLFQGSPVYFALQAIDPNSSWESLQVHLVTFVAWVTNHLAGTPWNLLKDPHNSQEIPMSYQITSKEKGRGMGGGLFPTESTVLSKLFTVFYLCSSINCCTLVGSTFYPWH